MKNSGVDLKTFNTFHRLRFLRTLGSPDRERVPKTPTYRSICCGKCGYPIGQKYSSPALANDDGHYNHADCVGIR